MLDKQIHEQILRNILKDIYTNKYLQGSLALKGGTCLYMFFGLDRFSVDLDFNLRSDEFNNNQLTKAIEKNMDITEMTNKFNTWFWLGSYKKAFAKIKVEVSKRDYPDKYIIKDFYGLSVPIMEPSYMFAHKLCAITDRKKIQNRDLFDAHFMFKQHFEINDEIIKIRTGKNVQEYFKYLIDYIDSNVSNSSILEGLGELLDDKQKNRVRDTLKRDILFDLRSRIV